MKKWIIMTTAVLIAGSAAFGQNKAKAQLYENLEEKKDPTGIELMPGVTAGVLVEAEAGYSKQGDEESTDLSLSTLELGLDAELTDGVKGHVLLLWEEGGDEAVAVDEAFITLGGTEKIPAYLEAGRLYVPFGVYNSHFISDPLTLELGETQATAAMIGYAQDFFEIKAGAFNGDLDDEGDDDQIQDLVASLTLTPMDGVELGAYWMSDLGESGGLEEGLAEAMEGTPAAVVVGTDGQPTVEPAIAGVAYEKVGGAGGYISLSMGAVTIDAEYITALDSFNAGLLGEEELTPQAWNLEVAFSVTDPLELAIRYEGTDEFPDMPEVQYGVAAAYGLTDNVSLAMEYMHGTFDDNEVDEIDLVTAQIGLEF
jgi:porin-like protein